MMCLEVDSGKEITNLFELQPKEVEKHLLHVCFFQKQLWSFHEHV